jgi:hypothetical protein
LGVSRFTDGEQAATKVLYLVANQHRTGRDNLIGRINGCKTILPTRYRSHATTKAHIDWDA